MGVTLHEVFSATRGGGQASHRTDRQQKDAHQQEGEAHRRSPGR